jgi:hypothetical protein
MKNKISLTICALFIMMTNSFSQDFEVGVSLGGAQYQGDLSRAPITWKETKLGLGALGRYNVNPHLSAKLAFNIGKIEGDDKNYISQDPNNADYYRWKRNLNFYSTLWEVSLQGEYNFMRFISGSPTYRFTPYVFVGVSLFHYNPKTLLDGQEYELRKFATELDKNGNPRTYSPFSVSLPSGLGVKFSLGKLWNIGLEAGIRKTFTDYLDDVSNQYPNITAMGPTTLAARLSDRTPEVGNTEWLGSTRDLGSRGDREDLDTYVFMGFTLTKTIRTRTCASFK